MHSVCLPLRFLSPLSIFAVQVQRKLLFAQRETLVLIDDGSYIDIELIRYLLEHLLTLSLRVFFKVTTCLSETEFNFSSQRCLFS